MRRESAAGIERVESKRAHSSGVEIMEETYKDHGILASAWQISDSDRFEPHVTVFWSEGERERAESAVFPLVIPTERDAEVQGLQLAKKWIDDGKPEVRVGGVRMPVLRYVGSCRGWTCNPGE